MSRFAALYGMTYMGMASSMTDVEKLKKQL